MRRIKLPRKRKKAYIRKWGRVWYQLWRRGERQHERLEAEKRQYRIRIRVDNAGSIAALQRLHDAMERGASALHQFAQALPGEP